MLLTSTPDQLPTHCKKVTVNYVPNNVCTGFSSYNGDVDGNIMVCGTDPNAGKDSCQGDSGGPIVTWNLNDPSDCSRFGVLEGDMILEFGYLGTRT